MTSSSLEKRKKFIIDTVYIALIVGLFFLFLKYAFGLFIPFVIAFFLAMLLQRPVNFIVRKTRLKKGITSAFLVLFVVLVIGSILVLLLARIFIELRGFFSFLIMKLEDTTLLVAQVREWLVNNLDFLPQTMSDSVTTTAISFLEKLLGMRADTGAAGTAAQSGFDLSVLSSPLGAIWGTAKQIPMIAVAVLVSIVCCCFMTADYNNMRAMILAQAGDKASSIIRTKQIIFSTLGKMGKAYGIIISITFVEMMIGLTILKAFGIYTGGYVFAIALLTAIVDVLPVLGTGTVLIPWALWSLFTGNYGLGIGLLVIYGVITVIRQIIEPKLVAAQLGMPAFVTLMAMYIGTQLFGFLGLFLLPITLVILKVLNDEEIIHILKKVPEKVPDAPAEENPPKKEKRKFFKK